ncbi:hypothetical protein [Streptosporangium sp. CA-115845]|uniref:hypothetical protein n=1 Tax=Streptosporangium sp. CA-115845 TaxID=3240071 RepID=UPI003D8E6870
MIVSARYRLTGLLGGEGDDAVWRARDELLRRDVAMKEIRLAPERELFSARKAVEHRRISIAGIHDLVEEGGRTWLVMGLDDGGPPGMVIAIRRRRVPVWGVVGIAAVLVGGLLIGITLLRDEGEATVRVNAPAVGPGRFAARPKPCDLISADQLGELFREGKPSIVNSTSEMCLWSVSGASLPVQQPSLRYQVKWFPPGDAGPARADLYYESLRASSVRDLPGIGDEALLREHWTDERLTMKVHFRVSNLVVETSYYRWGDDAFGTLEQGAQKAAKAAADKLG